jgi:DNA polymerase-3 subunit beta
MKISLPLQLFADALNIVGKASGGKNIKPILANVLISAENDELRLAGTDMEVLMTCKLPATVERPGQCTISAKLLTELVATLPVENENAVVTMESQEGQDNLVCLRSGKAKSHLQVQGIEEFPPIPVFETEPFPRFDFDSSLLKKALKEVAIAMGVDESNPTQRSVCLTFAEGSLRFVATDSRRLAINSIAAVHYPPEFERSFIIPSRSVPELIRLLEEEKTVNIGLFKEQLLFTARNFIMLTRLYDGKFPDFRRILPKEFSRRLSIKHKDMVQALRAINPISRHSNFMIHFEIGPNETRLWSESKEEGTAEVFISTTMEGDPIKLAFNGRFISDFLGVCDTEEVSVEMTTPSYPGVFKPKSPDNEFSYVVMPMTY